MVLAMVQGAAKYKLHPLCSAALVAPKMSILMLLSHVVYGSARNFDPKWKIKMFTISSCGDCGVGRGGSGIKWIQKTYCVMLTYGDGSKRLPSLPFNH